MKLRGTARGLNLLLEARDTAPTVHAALEERAALLDGHVDIELDAPVPADAVETALNAIHAAGGTPGSIGPNTRAPGEAPPPPPARVEVPVRTEIIRGTLRSGARREVRGSVIVLGDVNPGVELIAGGDIIVLGTLRGLAHAGALGSEDAIIWAQRIAAPQVRIAAAVARAPEGSSLDGMRSGEDGPAEVARLENGQIVIEPHNA